MAGQHSSSDKGFWAANGDQYPVSMTGLAGMALLMEGSTIREGKYAAHIRKAADWLMEKSQDANQRDGLIGNPDHPTEAGRYMYGHGFATLFLAWSTATRTDQKKRAAAQGHPDAGRQVHRQRPIDAGRLVLHLQGRRPRPGRRLGHRHANAGPARLPERRHPGAQGHHQERRRLPQEIDHRSAAASSTASAAAASVPRRAANGPP